LPAHIHREALGDLDPTYDDDDSPEDVRQSPQASDSVSSPCQIYQVIKVAYNIVPFIQAVDHSYSIFYDLMKDGEYVSTLEGAEYDSSELGASLRWYTTLTSMATPTNTRQKITISAIMNRHLLANTCWQLWLYTSLYKAKMTTEPAW